MEQECAVDAVSTSVEKPDFDGFKVDFDECMQRQGMFREEEHECRIGRGM